MTEQDALSRRDFLKGSAAAVAAMSVGVFGAAEKKAKAADLEPVVCGFIGTGSQGQLDLGRLMRVPGVKVAAVCDIYPPHLKKGMEIAQTMRGYTDYRWMLERKDIQAICIATPLYLHAQMAIDAMQAGKHVFTEKMMAYSIDQAKAMVRTARETRKILQVGHQRRYSQMYNHAFDLVKQGVLGKITHVRLMWNRNGSWRRAVPEPKYERLLNWRLYREYSQGLMAELGSHLLHVTNWFLEATPLSVIGMGGIDYWKDGREVYDNVNVIWEYPGGIKVYFQSLTTNQFDNCYEQFMGDKGTLVLGNKALLYPEPKAERLAWSDFAHKEKVDGKEAILLDAGATKKLDEQAAKKGEEIGGGEAKKDDYLSEMESFISCIREGKQPLCNAEEGFKATVTCLLANEAMEKGKKLFFKPEMFEV
ncbi:MAG: Gfo/Idh/MocA family oxidoreductase [Armatimonadota bacterium]|nr:Gfo/Idh/MocA family oxidoreductase [Armatimonadota bacterium]